jgi:hypothetical protein
MARSTVLLEKLIVVQLVKKLHTFLELKDSLLCPWKATTGSYSEPSDSSPHLPTLFIYNPF